VCFDVLAYLIHSYDGGTINTPLLQMTTSRQREVKPLAKVKELVGSGNRTGPQATYVTLCREESEFRLQVGKTELPPLYPRNKGKGIGDKPSYTTTSQPDTQHPSPYMSSSIPGRLLTQHACHHLRAFVHALSLRYTSHPAPSPGTMACTFQLTCSLLFSTFAGPTAPNTP
jgi:hypothetical protein